MELKLQATLPADGPDFTNEANENPTVKDKAKYAIRFVICTPNPPEWAEKWRTETVWWSRVHEFVDPHGPGSALFKVGVNDRELQKYTNIHAEKYYECAIHKKRYQISVLTEPGTAHEQR